MEIHQRPSGLGSLLREGGLLAWRSASGVLVFALLFSLLVGGVVLPPLLGLLQRLGQYGGDVIVGNYTVLPWVLSGRGLLWGFLLLSSWVFLTVLFFAGLFLLFSLRGEPGSLRRICLAELWRRLPEMLVISGRWSLVLLAAAAVLGIAPGLGFLLFLREHDINYYLKSQPPEWWLVIGVSAVWISVAGFLLVRGLLRVSLFFPLWVRGHGSLKVSARESWGFTRGHERRLILLVLAVLGSGLAAQLLFDVALFKVMDLLLPTSSASMTSTLVVFAGGILLFVIVSLALVCLQVAWLCAIWTLVCDELCPEPQGLCHRTSAVPGEGSRAWRYLALGAAFTGLFVFVLHRALTLPQQAHKGRPLVVAHRGGAGEAPENATKGFALALAKGRADMLEMDVAMSADEVLILAHDSDLMRQAGDPRKLNEISWAEMSLMTLRTPQSKGEQEAPVAKIEEVLRLVGRRLPMIVEFKHSKRTPNLVPRTVALVRELGLLDRVTFMSLDIADLHEVKRQAPEARTGYFVSVEMGKFLELKMDCIAPRHTLVTRQVVLEAGERGVPVFAWTVDDPVRVVELLDLGVDGIITNEPTRVRRIVEAYFELPAEARSLLRFRRLWGLLVDWGEFRELVDSAREDNQP